MIASAGSDQLLIFIKFLRGRDIPISPADTLDAVHVASLLGYQDRETLKQGLASVLAKSRPEAARFNDAFDTFFRHVNSTPERSGGGNETRDAAPSTTEAPRTDSPAAGSMSGLEQLATENGDLAELLASPLVRSLSTGDDGALAVAIEQAAGAAGVDGIKLFTQRGQYIRRLLDALGEQQLRDAAIALENRHQQAFEEVQALRESLRERVRDRVERAYMVHAAGNIEDYLDQALAEVKLGNISPHQMARMRKLIDRMARKLASRHGRRRRKTRRGQLNVAATLRGAVATDGIPFNPRWRKVERRKPQIMAICDVSGDRKSVV